MEIKKQTKIERLIKEIKKKIKPKERYKFLYRLKCSFYGEKNTILEENILDRYNNSEYWDYDLSKNYDEGRL